MKRKRSYFHYSRHSDRREKNEEAVDEVAETTMEKRKNKKKISWNEEAEFLLIQLWEEYIDTLRGTRKNRLVYEEIANVMVNEGHNFSGDEVRVKIHNLTNRYKLEKRNIEHNGGYSSWHYYDSIHSIINSKKADTILEAGVENKEECKEEEEEVEEEPVGSEEPDQLEESMCSIEAIESYKPAAENKEGRKRRRDDKKSVHGSDILKMLRDSTEIMKREAEDRRRADAKMLRLQEELVEIERERNDILKEILR